MRVYGFCESPIVNPDVLLHTGSAESSSGVEQERRHDGRKQQCAMAGVSVENLSFKSFGVRHAPELGRLRHSGLSRHTYSPALPLGVTSFAAL